MPDSDIQRLVERMTPTTIYVQWSDDGQHIRKWSHEPFDGGTAFVPADTITDLRAEVEMLKAALTDLLDASHCYMIDAARGRLFNDDGESVSAGMASEDFAVWNRVAPLVGVEPDSRAALTQTKDTTDDA